MQEGFLGQINVRGLGLVQPFGEYVCVSQGAVRHRTDKVHRDVQRDAVDSFNEISDQFQKIIENSRRVTRHQNVSTRLQCCRWKVGTVKQRNTKTNPLIQHSFGNGEESSKNVLIFLQNKYNYFVSPFVWENKKHFLFSSFRLIVWCAKALTLYTTYTTERQKHTSTSPWGLEAKSDLEPSTVVMPRV